MPINHGGKSELSKPKGKDVNNDKKSAQYTSPVILPFAVDKEYYFNAARVKKKPIYAFIKRLFDFLSCFIGLVVLLPLFIIIAIIIKCSLLIRTAHIPVKSWISEQISNFL